GHGGRDRVPGTGGGRRPASKHHRDLRLRRRRPAGIEHDEHHQGTRLRDPARRQDRQHELRWAARSGTRPGAADRSREGDSCDRCRGNNGPKSPPLYPGADPNVMAITATDASDRLFNGANQGKYNTVAAPGVDILVPAPNGALQFTTGTSVAAANVSGVAALLIARKPSLTPEEIRAILVRTAKHLGYRGINPQFGAGLVDPLKALELVTSYMPEQDGVRRFLASPDASSKYIEDGFSALGYARDDRLGVTKTTRPLAAPSRDWLAWIDVRGGDFNRNTFGS